MQNRDFNFGDSEWDLLVKILEREGDIFDRMQQILTAVGSGGGGGGGNVNLTGINGVAPSVGCGVSTAGTLRVAHATDCTIPVSAASLPLPTGASTAALQTQPGVDIGDVTVNNAAGAAAVNIQDGGNSITVDGTVAVSTLGTITPGTAATNLGKAEDAAHTSGDVGVMALGVANVAQTAFAADGDYIPQSTDLAGNKLTVGNIAHDGVDAGNPLGLGVRAIAFGTNPTAVAAADRSVWYGNRAGVPFVLGGHPNVITLEAEYTTAQTNTAIVTVAGGLKIVVTNIAALCDNANTVDVGLRVGFATATTPTTTGVVLTHPGIAPGSGYNRGDGNGILGVGADGEDLRITSEVPTTGALRILVTYFTIES